MTNTKTNTKDFDIKAQLENGVKAILTSDNYKNWLDTASKFHTYSFNNQVLILMQKPEASRVAGFSTWKNMKRWVKKGEKAIKVIAPCPHKKTVEDVDQQTGEVVEKTISWTSFKVVNVFDVSQTDGEPLPEVAPKALTSDVDGYGELVEKLRKSTDAPIEFGQIDGSAKGYYTPGAHTITVKEGMEQAQTIKTMVHEIAHSLMHQEGCKLSREVKEIQAESVAYIVASHIGLDTGDYSFPYIAGWAGTTDIKALTTQMTEISKTAQQIIALL